MKKKQYTLHNFYKDAKQVLTDRNFSIPEAELEVTCTTHENIIGDLIFRFGIGYTNDPHYLKLPFERQYIFCSGDNPEKAIEKFDQQILERFGVKPEDDSKYVPDFDVILHELPNDSN